MPLAFYLNHLYQSLFCEEFERSNSERDSDFKHLIFAEAFLCSINWRFILFSILIMYHYISYELWWRHVQLVLIVTCYLSGNHQRWFCLKSRCIWGRACWKKISMAKHGEKKNTLRFWWNVDTCTWHQMFTISQKCCFLIWKRLRELSAMHSSKINLKKSSMFLKFVNQVQEFVLKLSTYGYIDSTCYHNGFFFN